MTATTKKQEEVKEVKHYFRPIGNNVLLLAVLTKGKWISGPLGETWFEYPHDKWELQPESIVLAVGPDCKNVKPGDKVLMNTARTPMGMEMFGVTVLNFNEFELLGVTMEGDKDFEMNEFIKVYLAMEEKKKQEDLEKMRKGKPAEKLIVN